MTNVEIRTVESSNAGGDRFLTRAPMTSVPAAGEIVNVNGNPYIVHDRSWAIGRDNNSYAVLRVVRYQPHLTLEEATGFFGFAHAAWILNHNGGLGMGEKDAILAQWRMIDQIAEAYPELAKRFASLVKRANDCLSAHAAHQINQER